MKLKGGQSVLWYRSKRTNDSTALQHAAYCRYNKVGYEFEQNMFYSKTSLKFASPNRDFRLIHLLCIINNCLHRFFADNPKRLKELAISI